VRNPRATLLYHLVEAYFDQVKGQWAERFEGRYGFWLGFVDEQVRRYLDCGLFDPAQLLKSGLIAQDRSTTQSP
jgi:hypothetical protein